MLITKSVARMPALMMMMMMMVLLLEVLPCRALVAVNDKMMNLIMIVCKARRRDNCVNLIKMGKVRVRGRQTNE